MATYIRPQVKSPDWSRTQRAVAPKLLGVSPALNTPRESANVILNKQVATLSRAGSNPGNPILAGLGITAQIAMGQNDRLIALYFYRDQNVPGANLVAQASTAGQYATFEVRAGSGRTVAGSVASGAVKNFIRYQTEGGAVEREFWIKNYDADVVTADSKACLDTVTLLPVEIPLTIVDAGRDWIEVPVDFMPSWNDEFQVLALSGGQQAEAGFRKPYGGVLFVSFFDKTPGTEGVGVQVNPISQDVIYTRRSIQVQNTAGLKEITVRFRSKQNSSFYVDVPIKFLVTAPDVELCDPPFSEPCSSVYLKAGAALPADCPAVASTPDVQVVAGVEGDPLGQDLLVVTVHGTAVGAAPKLRIWRWKWVANAKALAGADLEEVGSPEDYVPLVLSGTSPVEALPYGAPHRLTIALSVVQLRSDLVAFLDVVVIDGDHVSSPISIPGPKARDVGTMPIGGLGGTGADLCAYGLLFAFLLWSLISGLLKAGSPPDVSRLVVPIIVDAVDREVGTRPKAYVLKESLEGRLPASADGDSSSPVVFVIPALLVEAPLLHRLPDLIFGAGTLSPGHRVSRVNLGGEDLCSFRPEAAAAFDLPRQKGVDPDRSLSSAFAFAKPIGLPAFCSGEGIDRQAAEDAVGNILAGAGLLDRLEVNHRSSNQVRWLEPSRCYKHLGGSIIIPLPSGRGHV